MGERELVMTGEDMELQNNNPHVAFCDSIDKRNKNHYLFIVEPYSIRPRDYDEEIWRQYKGIISWNGRLCETYKNRYNMIKCNGMFTPNRKTFDEHKIFDDKINGICLICRYRRRPNVNGSIVNLRLSIMLNIKSTNKLETHCYGKKAYGGDMYRGVIGNTFIEKGASSVSKLRKLSEYKFNLCMENNYHKIWSYGYTTARLFDCFRAKTIGVYHGCYNIRDIVPSDLYINYGDFENDIELTDHLANMKKGEYERMVNDAYKWDENNRIGNMHDINKLLQGLIGK